jgi:hypothetical protein
MGNANRRWKPRRTNDEFSNQKSRALWEGIKQHLDTDKIFHNSDFFRIQTKDIRILLEKNGLKDKGIKLYFLAHIILELLLDRLILKSCPGIADRFYTDLILIEEDFIRAELDSCTIQDNSRFFEIFSRFKASRYLYHYLDDKRLLLSINRISERAKQSPMNNEMNKRMMSSILEAERNLQRLFPGFFEGMKK